MSEADPYLYPGLATLKNKLGVRDAELLEYFERRLVAERTSEGVPSGQFDLIHLRAIHRHLFQDVYDWAGVIRVVELAKDGHQFQFRRYIETGMTDVHRRLREASFLAGLSAHEFAEKAGVIIGDVNYVHPFREGNGRTQLLYLMQLARRAGHILDPLALDPAQWIAASRQAHIGDYGLFQEAIALAIRAD